MTLSRAALLSPRSSGFERGFLIDARQRATEDPLSPGEHDSTLVEWHDVTLGSAAGANAPSGDSSVESTDPTGIVRSPWPGATVESRSERPEWKLLGAHRAPEYRPAFMSGLGARTFEDYDDLVTPGQFSRSRMVSFQGPREFHRIESEPWQYMPPSGDVDSPQTFVWVSRYERQTQVGLKVRDRSSDFRHAADSRYLEPVSDLVTAERYASVDRPFYQSVDDFTLGLSRSLSDVVRRLARSLREAREPEVRELLVTPSHLPRDTNTLYRAMSRQFVPLTTQHFAGSQRVRRCANHLAGAGLNVLAERVVELYRLVREEEESLDFRSLGFACDFLVEHDEFGPPQLSVTPRGDIQALWRNAGERALIVMDFLPDALVKYAALATDRHPALHSDSTSGLARASRAMDELKLFLTELGRT